MEKFSIVIATLPDRERPVAEVAYGNIQWVEISQEKDDLVIQFYPHPTKKSWDFPYEQAMKAIEEAKDFLIESR